MDHTSIRVKKIYLGKNVPKKHYIQAQKKILDPDEKIVGFFRGKRDRYSGSTIIEKFEQFMGMKSHYLAITSKKIIFWMKGYFTKDFVSYHYDKVVSVEGKKGITAGDLMLQLSGHHERFRDMKRGEGVVASQMIQNVLNYINENKIHGTPISQPNTGATNPLTIVQSRYAKGEISKKEFDQLRMDIQKSNPQVQNFCKACGVENNSESVYCIGCGTTLD